MEEMIAAIKRYLKREIKTMRNTKKREGVFFCLFILYLCLFDARGYYPPPGSNARTSATVRVGCCVASRVDTALWVLAAVAVPSWRFACSSLSFTVFVFVVSNVPPAPTS